MLFPKFIARVATAYVDKTAMALPTNCDDTPRLAPNLQPRLCKRVSAAVCPVGSTAPPSAPGSLGGTPGALLLPRSPPLSTRPRSTHVKSSDSVWGPECVNNLPWEDDGGNEGGGAPEQESIASPGCHVSSGSTAAQAKLQGVDVALRRPAGQL
ncbi:hypothetical protein EYF80_031237 [Liparis tanakae]|uniref:Uncharacterized protein n=1 Tax=Liparis tanakae TaxID=230148 RepID=A0A4Z2GY90_9TELE|nr:hypothetical protein EYF80_031237 [Liparis tanakae]